MQPQDGSPARSAPWGALRFLLVLLLILALAPGTWLRSELPPPCHDLNLHFQPLPLPPQEVRTRDLGPFALEGVWQMKSTHVDATGFSALLPQDHGTLLAISDRGYKLHFSPPGAPPVTPWIAQSLTGRAWQRSERDSESATEDPATGTIWIGWEGSNAITRHRHPFGTPREVRPRAMRDWGINLGPEAMVRLADGRFIVLREGFNGWFEKQRHKALLFAGDPIISGEPQRFTFAGPAGFSPTDMAQLPDGRVLVLMRSLLWPFPARFAGRLVVADPRDIRPGKIWRGTEVARLESPLPVDNMEGMAIVPRADGTLTVWLISDDNNAAFQRIVLWRLSVDPAALPAHPDAAQAKRRAD